jgi:hypothetical protein
MTRPIDRVLERLEGVRRSGRGWRADSPCGNKSRGSLSITESDAGGVLLCDFSGYTVAEVVEALGLRMTDLFPPSEKAQSAADRKANRDALALTGARAAADALLREALVLGALAGAIRSGSPIGESDAARAAEAVEAIDSVRLALARGVRA